MSTRVIIWKQGPFYPELGKKIVELPINAKAGPSDDLIIIEGFSVEPDANGNFVEGVNREPYSEDDLDAINTYAIIRIVINLYNDLFGKAIKWSWWEKGNKDPLKVRIRNNDINARYLKEQKCIELDFYGPFNKWTFYCRTVDIIAHEAGHAILDSLKPMWENGDTEARGLVEAFCDLTAMFVILKQIDLCEYVIMETDGDFSKNSILTSFGVGHGFDERPNSEIRNALNDKKYIRNHESAYHYSEVVVGLLYDLLCNLIIDNSCNEEIKSVNLRKCGQIWIAGVFNAFISCDSEKPTLVEFGNNLLEIFEEYNDIIKQCLKVRKILSGTV